MEYFKGKVERLRGRTEQKREGKKVLTGEGKHNCALLFL